MHRFFATLVACAALSAGCTYTKTQQEQLDPKQPAPTKSAHVEQQPMELSSGIWSVLIEIDIPTHNQEFVTGGDHSTVASKLLATYQRAFTVELQTTLRALLQRNVHCTVSALSVVHAREVWVEDGNQGGPMALPSGAIVILPCGGNEPLVKPEAPTPPMPH